MLDVISLQGRYYVDGSLESAADLNTMNVHNTALAFYLDHMDIERQSDPNQVVFTGIFRGLISPQKEDELLAFFGSKRKKNNKYFARMEGEAGSTIIINVIIDKSGKTNNYLSLLVTYIGTYGDNI